MCENGRHSDGGGVSALTTGMLYFSLFQYPPALPLPFQISSEKWQEKKGRFF